MPVPGCCMMGKKTTTRGAERGYGVSGSSAAAPPWLTKLRVVFCRRCRAVAIEAISMVVYVNRVSLFTESCLFTFNIYTITLVCSLSDRTAVSRDVNFASTDVKNMIRYLGNRCLQNKSVFTWPSSKKSDQSPRYETIDRA